MVPSSGAGYPARLGIGTSRPTLEQDCREPFKCHEARSLIYPSGVPTLRLHDDSAGPNRPTTLLETVLPPGKHGARGLYVHVTFCFHKCHYCDFYSLVDREGQSPAYLARLEADIEWVRTRVAAPIETVFVGGGTPTLLSAQELRALCATIRRLPLGDACEWTVEANPETIDQEKADALVAGGVNRISIGAQSFDPKHLKTLERWHDPANVARAVSVLRAAGIANINLDLIFGIPGQTLEEWRSDLARALELGPEHISCYGLTYEANTAMTKRLERGDFAPCEEDLEAAMYDVTRERLAAAGFAQYEISNFARAGRECRHNLVYWRNEPWWAVGPSASGFVAGHRFKVVPRLGDWLARASGDDAQPVVEHEAPDEKRNVSESLMLGLRLMEGIDRELEVRSITLEPGRAVVIARAIDSGLLERTPQNRLRFTHRGAALANEVLTQLV